MYLLFADAHRKPSYHTQALWGEGWWAGCRSGSALVFHMPSWGPDPPFQMNINGEASGGQETCFVLPWPWTRCFTLCLLPLLFSLLSQSIPSGISVDCFCPPPSLSRVLKQLTWIIDANVSYLGKTFQTLGNICARVRRIEGRERRERWQVRPSWSSKIQAGDGQSVEKANLQTQ